MAFKVHKELMVRRVLLVLLALMEWWVLLDLWGLWGRKEYREPEHKGIPDQLDLSDQLAQQDQPALLDHRESSVHLDQLDQ